METRRTFMRKSALAVGVVAAGSSLVTRATALDQPPPVDPGEYPWDLAVGNPARASLYLLGSRPLGKLLRGPMTSSLLHMSNRRAFREPADPDREKLQVAANESLGNLRNGLDLAHRKMHGAGSGYPSSYLELACADLSDWEEAVRDALSELDQHVTVPPLTADREMARNLDGALIDKYGSRTLRELFTTPMTDIAEEELTLWRAVRDAGVLWCSPRYHLRDQQDRVGPLIGNGYKCDPLTHRCVIGSSNDYCQEVDGVCNAMGT